MSDAHPDRPGLADAVALERLAANPALATHHLLPSGRIVSGEQVHAWLTADDPTIVEVRAAAHYAAAHTGWSAA